MDAVFLVFVLFRFSCFYIVSLTFITIMNCRVVNYHDTVGYKFLLLGPAFDGLVGGMA